MSCELVFYYDVLSPYSYLCFRRLGSLARRTPVTLQLRPVSLPRLLEATGNPPPLGHPAKAAWLRRDCLDLARYYGIPLEWPEVHPQRTGRAMSVLAQAEDSERHELTRQLFDAIWVRGLDLGRPEVLAELVGPDRLEAAACPEARERLAAHTRELEERGGFGVPSLWLDGRLFFGNDRLFLVERALNA